ncbi:hypothetical protein SAMN04488057_12265 [Cyclobacterium lianum]|uniref:Uncharacterized protein n=1 Tax=Cyclobacterium lianum TaxID=388280 RepID=A0A1M7QS07_9BACT|nr:hypothetical protein SAMN04488057_12265 [Cyclobacterium lianum]
MDLDKQINQNNTTRKCIAGLSSQASLRIMLLFGYFGIEERYGTNACNACYCQKISISRSVGPDKKGYNLSDMIRGKKGGECVGCHRMQKQQQMERIVSQVKRWKHQIPVLLVAGKASVQGSREINKIKFRNIDMYAWCGELVNSLLTLSNR